MSYPPQYPSGGHHGYGAPPGPGYGPGPRPPSSGGNTVAVVIISVVSAGVLLLIGIFGFILFMAPPGDGSDSGSAGEGPDFDVDGEWSGTLTQYDPEGNVHGSFDVSVTIQGNEVVHAEETSEDFDFDLCEWNVHNVTWSGDTLSFDYDVVPEHLDGQSCAPTGDAQITFHESDAADIESNEVAEGVLYPAD